MHFRDLIKRLTRHPSRLLGDELGDYSSVTSFDDAELDPQTKNDIPRESQRLWNISIRTLTGAFAQPGRDRRYDICSLDEGILAGIFESLGLVDQVCFALTCKFLLKTYKGIIKDEAILPQQPTTHHLPLSFVNSDDELRVKLLMRLENSQWAYCAECFLLKPRRMFALDALAGPPLKRRCKRYDGVIKLCPCLHLTRRDRNNMRALLRSSFTPPPTNYGHYGILSDEWRSEDHVCPYLSTNNEEVQISVILGISSTGWLSLYGWYSLHLPVSSGDQSGPADPIFACPHLNLLDLVHAAGNTTGCRICHATVWRWPESQKDPGRVRFNTYLSLWYADESDHPGWRSRCYIEGDTQYVAPSLHSRLYCHAD